MKIKLDENLSRHLKDALLGLGHDVSTALEEGLLGKDDVELGAAAKTDGRMVFTLDLDFADLRKFPRGIASWSHFVQTSQRGTVGC